MSTNAPYLHQLVLSIPNFWGFTWFNLWPFRFIKCDQYLFPTIDFPSSSVTTQHWNLNEFNFTLFSLFEIKSLKNWSVLETLIRWWHFDIAMIILQTSSSIFRNIYGKPFPCPYGTWFLPALILCDISVFVILWLLGSSVFCYFINILLKESNWQLLTIKLCFLPIHNSCYFILIFSNTYFDSSFLLIYCSFWVYSFLSWCNIWISMG